MPLINRRDRMSIKRGTGGMPKKPEPLPAPAESPAVPYFTSGG
ncbi:hypothetical protein KNP414_05588 [Paenibacillus mucilaginosus KNP414]|uniref:Uncharacterized protein n=1 Tax=Paenibacillus mucilaginosus (strain KNP414) TaxID=1036673 RepID=F8FLI5_PAEMK|nr:hypothetical protein KNP414_05588 [Paenibacillus mucilaginosus KNP414]